MAETQAKEYRKLSDLHEWNKNPRSITKDGFDRLKKQIQKLGQYKPLLITNDGTILGGNMRYKAYKDLGIGDVWVSVVNPKNESERLEYALSDNDRAGFYDEDLLANLMSEYDDFQWDNYSIDLAQPQSMKEILEQLGTTYGDKNKEINLDAIGEELDHQCPRCGFRYNDE